MITTNDPNEVAKIQEFNKWIEDAVDYVFNEQIKNVDLAIYFFQNFKKEVTNNKEELITELKE